jgi:hypothetical protein
VVGGLDIKLSLELNGKEYGVVPYYTDKDRVYGNLIPLSYGKKKGDTKDYTDDDFIKDYLDRINSGKMGFGSYLEYISVPADKPVYPEGEQRNYLPGKWSKNVYSIIQDPYDKDVIPEEDEDLKTRRKLWDDYNAAKKVADPKKPITGSASNSENAIAPVPDEPRVDPLSVTGKLFVKKKSGPGEITGVVEAEIVNANVVFKDLQFTDPGFYVITISHGESSTLVDPIDVSIEVLSEDVVTPQEESKGTETDAKVTGNRPIIAQIDKPQVVINEIVQQQDKLAGNASMNFGRKRAFNLVDKEYRNLVYCRYDITFNPIFKFDNVDVLVTPLEESYNLISDIFAIMPFGDAKHYFIYDEYERLHSTT